MFVSEFNPMFSTTQRNRNLDRAYQNNVIETIYWIVNFHAEYIVWNINSCNMYLCTDLLQSLNRNSFPFINKTACKIKNKTCYLKIKLSYYN